MKTTLRARNKVTVIDLEGALDYESTATFRDVIKNYLATSSNDKSILINMEKLNFIGSMGVNEFVAMMKEFNTDYPAIKFCGAQQDFKRLIRYFASEELLNEIFEDEETAVNQLDI